MAPTKLSVPRRSERITKPAGASALTVDDTNRIAKSTPKASRKTCSTCDRTIAQSNFYKRLPTKTCAHTSNTCKTCLKCWLTTQLESTTYDKLSCPECAEILQHGNVKKVATKETYQKFDDLERRAYQEKTPGWRWCLAPNCRAGQVHGRLLEAGGGEVDSAVESKRKKTTRGAKKKATTQERQTVAIKTEDDDDPSIFTCTTCGARACIPCDRPYHDFETCKQYAERIERQQGEEEEASLATIKAECKPCPKCNKNIEKNGGCDQVYCTQCYDSFCWLCETSYKVIDKKGHTEGCIYAIPGRIDPHAAPNAPGMAAAGNGVFGHGRFGHFAANIFGVNGFGSPPPAAAAGGGGGGGLAMAPRPPLPPAGDNGGGVRRPERALRRQPGRRRHHA